MGCPRCSALALAVLCGCGGPGIGPEGASTPRDPAAIAREAGVPLTSSPDGEVHASWKERLEQAFVFVEHRGGRAGLGEAMGRLQRLVSEAGVRPVGPPFGLYDDSAVARACVAVEAAPARDSGLGFDILPRAMVAYAAVAGAYPEVERARPGILRYMARMGWEADGPVREVYLVNPGTVSEWKDLVCEVQIPWATGR